MSCNLVIIPTEQGVGSSTIKLGISHALEQHGYSVAIFHPFKNSEIDSQQLHNFFLENRQQDLLEIIMQKFEQFRTNYDFVLIEGIYSQITNNNELAWFAPHVEWFNNAITRALMGYVIIVTRPTTDKLSDLEENISLALNMISPEFILGVIVSKVSAPLDHNGRIKFSFLDEDDVHSHAVSKSEIELSYLFTKGKVQLLGVTAWNKEMTQPRVMDIMNALNVPLITTGADVTRRVKRITLCSRGINNVMEDLQAGTLIIAAIDRSDLIITASLAESQGIKLAGMLLTADYEIPHETLKFCYTNQKNKLPIYANQDSRKTMSFILALKDLEMNIVQSDDSERFDLIKREISESINISIIESKLNNQVTKKMSPAAFRYMLIQKATQAQKRIVLPEGEELRTLTAGIHCHSKGIAKCTLLGDFGKISQLAKANNLQIPNDMKILNPQDIAPAYIDKLVELRKSKGMTPEIAFEMLTNDVNYLATMMINSGEVDGMVSGAENTTAATVRPALQIVKTKPGNSLVSSVFFMCMEEQVLVYGDCAINPDPNAEELADIAIQSADTATQFNIEPRIAMISYSTGSSGTGADVEKVKRATDIVRQKRPDILIDGPLQYDAAMIKEVGEKKAPNSQVAGRATVCIFPDLNTGNTTYKAVQRSANVLSIGPLLQGLNKPVNDLSRGATIDDIIYTIAITAVQS